jgi:hypothetical protein
MSCLTGDGSSLRQNITALNPHHVAWPRPSLSNAIAARTIWRTLGLCGRRAGREGVDLSVLFRQVADPAAEMPRCKRHLAFATATPVTVHSPAADTAIACDVTSGRNVRGTVTSKLGNGVQGPPVGAIPTLTRAGSISPRGCTGGVLSMAIKWRSFIAASDDSGLIPGNRRAATSLTGHVAPAGAPEPPRRR